MLFEVHLQGWQGLLPAGGLRSTPTPAAEVLLPSVYRGDHEENLLSPKSCHPPSQLLSPSACFGSLWSCSWLSHQG